MRRPKAHTREILIHALKAYCSGDVADVGCGRAKYQNLIREYSKTYTTIDNGSSGPQFSGVNFVPDIIADVGAISVENDSFDTVICTEVLEHVQDPFLVVREISRILRSGGHAIISSGWISPYHQEPEDYWRFSIPGYKVLCERNGLEFVTSYRKGGYFTLMLYMVSRSIFLNAGPFFTKIWRRLDLPMQLLMEKLDPLIKTEDTIGHVIVAYKR